MEDEGYIVTFIEKNWNFTKGTLVVDKGVKVDTLYLCACNIVPSILVVPRKLHKFFLEEQL